TNKPMKILREGSKKNGLQIEPVLGQASPLFIIGSPHDPCGGIMLSKPASQITLKQVVVVMEEIDSGAVKQHGFEKALIRYTDSVSRLIDILKPESLNE
ncbi:MAG: hypothetical protein O7C39_08290, partial [Bacteroidetes bacterium]|nr:hypothetical protein [Bacteroidota bacterium]